MDGLKQCLFLLTFSGQVTAFLFLGNALLTFWLIPSESQCVLDLSFSVARLTCVYISILVLRKTVNIQVQNISKDQIFLGVVNGLRIRIVCLIFWGLSFDLSQGIVLNQGFSNLTLLTYWARLLGSFLCIVGYLETHPWSLPMRCQ